MTETKTFKNVEAYFSAEGWKVYDTEETLGHFPMDGWDMEVTFTKKPKPPKFKAGDRVDLEQVEPEEFGSDPGTVVGYAEGKVGVVWDMNVYAGNEYPIHWVLEDDLKYI